MVGASSQIGRPVTHLPSIRRWLWMLSPASVRVNKCLPIATVSTTRCPVRSMVANRGTRKSLATRTRSRSAASRPARTAPHCVTFGHVSSGEG